MNNKPKNLPEGTPAEKKPGLLSRLARRVVVMTISQAIIKALVAGWEWLKGEGPDDWFSF